LFSVKVPVLSTHRTVIAPSVSIARFLRASTPKREIRRAPNVKNTLKTTGSSSGRSEIASVMPDSAAASHAPSRTPRITTSRIESAIAAAAIRGTSAATWRWIGAGASSIAPRLAPIRPISERGPVRVTSAIAWPAVTSVPAKTGSPRAGSRITGTDSPVSSDSSIDTGAPSASRASAGTRSPSAIWIASPGTRPRASSCAQAPSRRTRATGLARSRSASSARSVRRSWTSSMTMITTTDAPSVRASARSPKIT
jgi:hypothetical protein